MLKRHFIFTGLISILAVIQTKAQLTQTIRGTVVDKISNISLPGSTVELMSADPAIGVATDMDGNFKITNVPVGKQTLRISYLGYKQQVIPNIIVNSGKEVVLNITMEEDFVQAKEVTITAKAEKSKAQNELAVVSARTFSVEESQKFAAAVNDPARAASSFAGVINTDDGNNSISIRGNAPNGLLWRMEGVEIPNPNHFSIPGSAGGGISILSSQLLTNSDFLTSAFPAEYGNALSGVFDLKLRKGNNEKNEYTFQAGVLGIDFSTEGPFSKNYNGSYLINYRYSTLSLLKKMGVEVGEGETNFQDLSLNISLPTKKAGNFTLFGFGGLSSQIYDAIKDSAKWENDYEKYNSKFNANTGAAGLTHSIILSEKTYLRSSLTASNVYQGYQAEELDETYHPVTKNDEEDNQAKYSFSSVLNHKFNARQSLRAGVILSSIQFDLQKKDFDSDANEMLTTIDAAGNLQTVQAFAQTSFHLKENLTLNAGFHFLELTNNQSYSIEPRASLKYDINKKQSITMGYGLHSQLQPTGVYFAQIQDANGNYIKPNKDLGLSKSHHFVLAYDYALTEFMRAKVETYYQSLYNIPVRADIANSFSMLNESGGFITDNLTNDGTGRNYGVDLTLEQFLKKDLYFLLSGSLYDSKYKGSDEVLHNTRYNGNYSLTFTGGKEIVTGEKFKHRIIGLNIKTTYRGGFRDTPIDIAASSANGNNETVYIESQAFTEKYPAYFRTDIRFSIKRNRLKSTQTLALDIQNVTNRQNIYGRFYDSETGNVKTYYQTSLIPILSYKIEF